MKKRRLLGIVLSLCMVLALMPQMVFADETTTYDLWQVDGNIYYAATGTRTDFSTAEGGNVLPQGDHSHSYKLPYSGTYVLQTNIAMTESKPQIDITASGITLDLNGKVMTSYSRATRVISIEAENATIQDSVGGGKIIKGAEGSVAIEGNGSLALNSGTIETIKCFSGILYADGGTVNGAGTAANGTITQHTGTTGTTFTGHVDNGGAQSGTISGGIFYGEVYNGGSGVTCTISNGVFYGKVFNNTKSNITGGEFHNEVENTETITGGVFYDKVLNKSMEPYYIANISGGVFYGGIEHNGGTITDPYHTVSFDLNGASGTAPVTQYFVNTDTAQALEPAAPTREGYEFAGWYTDKELTDLYDFDSKVKENITLYAGFELPTLTVPFTTTVVKEEGSLDPPKDITFNLEVVSPSGDKISSDNVEITAESVTTNGAKSYDGTLKIKGTSEDIAKMLMGKVFVKQAEGDYPNWEVDDTVWGLVWPDEVVALASADSAATDNSIFIFPAEYVETENGGYYEMVEGEEAVDKMSFINRYTKSAANPSDTEGTTNGDSDDNADKNAKTGDDTNLALWLALMLLAGAGITGTTIYTRRKRTNE